MPNITIDNIDSDLDTLSDEAKAQLGSLQFVDAESLACCADSYNRLGLLPSFTP